MAYRETDYVRAKKEEKRLRILSVAETAFSEKGFGGTSTRELIQRSGLSTTAFYTHFSHKEDVLSALIEQITEELGEAIMRAIDDGKDPFDRLFQGFLNTLSVYKEHKALAKILLGDALAFTGEAGQKAKHLYRSVADIAKHGFQQMQDKQMLSGVDLEAFAYAMIGAINFQIFRWAVWEEISQEELEHFVRETARMIVGGVRAAGKHAASPNSSSA
jgi:AcrR family transcriptional regulator